jgi:hypothetical protein
MLVSGMPFTKTSTEHLIVFSAYNLILRKILGKMIARNVVSFLMDTPL